MDTKGIFVLLLYCKLLCLHNVYVSTAIVPALIWDPRNPLFRCGNLEIKVSIGDKLNLVCPSRVSNSAKLDNNLNIDELYENAYILQPHQEAEFHNCNATDAKHVLTCNEPEKLKSTSFVFRGTAGAPGVPVFSPRKTYYLIGTADGTVGSLSQTIGGHCSATNGLLHPLRVRIRVCSDEEIHVYKNCTVCDTLACYGAGCGNYSEWSQTSTFLWNGTHCFNKQTRTCIPSVGPCDKELERLVFASGNCSSYRKAERCESLKTSIYSLSASNQAIETESASLAMERKTTATKEMTVRSQPTSRAAPASLGVEKSVSTSTKRITSNSDLLSFLNVSVTSGLSSVASFPVVSKSISATSYGCSCPVQSTVGIKQPSSVQRPGEAKTSSSIDSAYLIVPSVIGGVILGIAMSIAAKYIAASKSKKQVAPYNETHPGINTEA